TWHRLNCASKVGALQSAMKTGSAKFGRSVAAAHWAARPETMLTARASFSMPATGAARGSSQKPATAVCSAPIATCRASDSGVSHEWRADKLLRRVAGHDERHRESGCRL